jgi:hypothetical protein
MFFTISVHQIVTQRLRKIIIMSSPVITKPIVVLNMRSRQMAKSNEDVDIDRIISLINNRETPTKISQLADGKQIVRAYRSAGSGSRKIHYDFCVDVENILDGTIQTGLRVEHKGSNIKKIIDPAGRLGVQFHNGSPKFGIILLYLTTWYNYWISSGRLTEKYGIQSPIPTLDKWLKSDATVQGNPKTSYGKELKQLARECNGPSSSLIAERDEFMENLVFNKEMVTIDHLEEIKQHVLETANKCLQEKDLWLQIAGNIHGEDSDFYHLWTPKNNIIESIVNVDMKIEGKKNIEFMFECDDGRKIGGIMRWGKGQGFSNFRFDLK